MASIWTQGPGTPAKKLAGNLPSYPLLVQQHLSDWAHRLAIVNNATIVLREEFESFLKWPDGAMFTVFAEFHSPPSAPEEGQPKICGQRGLVMHRGHSHVMDIPK